jgi:hypothetical protein
MSEPNKSRRQIATFLLLLFVFSAVFYGLILVAHKLEAGRGLYVSGLMWCFIDEFGVVLPIVTIAFAIFFWSRRGELQPIVRRPPGQQLAVIG